MVDHHTRNCWPPHRLCACLAALLLTSPLLPAHAQTVGPPVPAGKEPQLPSLVPPGGPPAVLQVPQRAPAAALRPGQMPRIVLREIRVTGNTVFSAQELAAITAPYVGRELSEEDLAALRQALTLKYVQAGYINSGALLPDQNVVDGIIEYRIVEGRLSDITVTGNANLRGEYVRDRLALAGAPPLNVNTLQDKLQVLLQGPFVERINAELAPGDRPGEARLTARIVEGPRSQVSAALDNDLSPGLGEARAAVRGQFFSPSGYGDVLGWELAYAQGYRKLAANYSVPLNARGTSLDFFAEASRAEVVEQPLNALDIQSRAQTLGLRLNHPVVHTARQQFSLALGLDVRQSESQLLGTGFAFSPGVEPDGKSKVSVIRFVQDYVARDNTQVTAARSTISLGVGAFGATNLGDAVPNGKFLAWLGQFQHVRRLGKTDNQLVLRADAQFSNRPLLPLEQFSVGGVRTVRGFRTNQLVRDIGYATSAELRIPVLRSVEGTAILQLAPFVDLGGAWYKGRDTVAPQRLSSAGVGLRYDPSPSLHAEIYYAHRMSGRNVVNPSRSLQDKGWHMALRASF